MLKAVVLAAGKGTRLYPITHRIAKPLLPLVNRTTLLYAFDKLKELGITEICLVVGENEPSMRETMGDGSAWDVNLTYVRQHDPRGLAHAVGFANEFVGNDPFILYLGDAIYSDGFQEQAAMFASKGGCANLNIVQWVEDPRRYGVAVLDGDRIVKLVEKPQNPESNWAMAGMYFFGPELWDVLPDLKPSARGEYEITDAIQMLVDRGDLVLAGRYEGTWFDTGTLDSFLATSKFLANGENVLAGSLNGKIGENVIVGAGATVECASISNTVVLPESRITGDAQIDRCLLGGQLSLEGSISEQILDGVS